MLLLQTPSRLTVSTTRLDNGLTVIHQETPATPVVVVDVWVRAGSVTEPDEWCGMAHFLEHMVFKGSDRIAPGEFDYAIESLGGATNAATSSDYAHYYIVTAKPYLPLSLSYLANLLLWAAIPDEEFLLERDVVLEELRQNNDDPDSLGFQALMAALYPKHPYGRPILGTEESLMGLSPETMRCFHRASYQPENMTVVVIGDIDRESALDMVQQHFEWFPDRPHWQRPTPGPVEPFHGIRRRELNLNRLEQSRLMLAWPCPGIDQTYSLPDQFRHAYGFDLLSTVLAEGRCSRLVRELREERHLVEGIACNFSLQRSSSLFTVTAWLDADNLDRVEAILCDRISELQSVPITQPELDRARRLLCNDYAFSTETPGQLAGLYGYYGTIAQADIALTYPDQIRTLQADELQALATEFLSPYRYAATTLRPAVC